MLVDIIKITFLSIAIGGASIPASFGINSSPVVVWVGNAAGSLLSAAVVIYVGNRITDEDFKKRVSKRRFGKKVIKVFDEGSDNKAAVKTTVYVNKHGLRLFSLFCPFFPGVLISTAAVLLLDLDRKIYR